MKFLKSLDDRVFLAENKINCLNKLFLIKLKNSSSSSNKERE